MYNVEDRVSKFINALWLQILLVRVGFCGYELLIAENRGNLSLQKLNKDLYLRSGLDMPVGVILHGMKKRILFLLPVLALLMGSCEKAVDFTPNEAAQKLVVEATIENGMPPLVILTRSLDYFSKISPAILQNSFVRNAVITVSNGTLTHRLKEYEANLGGGYKLYYYSVDTASLATAFVGAFNTKYSMTINEGGKIYTANTTIPPLNKGIDSAWWRPAPSNPDTTRTIIMVKVTDPPGYGNYVRVYNKRNSEPFFPPDNSVFDDLFIDGTTYEIQAEKGVNRNDPDPLNEGENKNFFKRGDTVTLKMSNIDKATYDFWRTMEFNYQGIGNPFSNPTKVIGNISGGALGYFGGYASTTKTVIIPK
jgi:Domain of unknown function (DUF4249)